jgi:hypothetical protein
MLKALAEIIPAGQKSGGANPPESFEVHVVSYVGFSTMTQHLAIR